MPRTLDPEALRAVPLPATACPNCGSLGVRAEGLGEGGGWVAPVGAQAWRCSGCGFSGTPIEFATREAYAEFLAGLP
ncbi:MAG TPA: hypothetical protein VHH36_02775 [Candidatus Thermoplasmatota archaeon]|nr:hypothetical protein [Candidatus Thermoplasmatota archaeon]